MAEINDDGIKATTVAEVANVVRRLTDKQAVAFIMQRYDCDVETAKYVLHKNRFREAMARGEIVSPDISEDGIVTVY